MFTKEGQYRVKEVLDKALQGHETSNFDCHVFTKDHRRLEVLLNATPRTDESGRIVGMLGVGQDITERKQVEMEKTQVAQELQTLIDTANAPIFGIDAQGLVNVWNNKTAEITSFAREEVLGKDLVQVHDFFLFELALQSRPYVLMLPLFFCCISRPLLLKNSRKQLKRY